MGGTEGLVLTNMDEHTGQHERLLTWWAMWLQ